MAPQPTSGLAGACAGGCASWVRWQRRARAALKERLRPERAPHGPRGDRQEGHAGRRCSRPVLAKRGPRSFAMFQAQDKLRWGHGAAGSGRPRSVFIPRPRVRMVLQRANRMPWVGNREAGLGVSEGLAGRVTMDLWAVPRVPLGMGFSGDC